MMRLGISGWRARGDATGIPRYIYNVVSRWTPEVVAGRFDEITFYTAQPFDRTRMELPPGIHERVLASSARMLVWENTRLGPAVKDDVLFCPSFSRPLVVRAKTVVAIHDTIPHRHRELFRRTQPFYNRLYSWSARRASLVLTSTNAAARDIEFYCGAPASRIRVVPLAAADAFHPVSTAVSTEVRQRVLGSLDPYFMFVGKTSGRRRVPELIEAFARFKQATRSTHKLVLVGPKPTFDLDEVVRRFGAVDVHHLGFVPDDDVNALYGSTDGLVWPSFYEHVSLPIFEAQAAGAPVVCVDTPGSRETTGGSALFLQEPDAASMAQAMTTLAASEALRTELRQGGLDNSRQYSWERTARETLDVLSEAAAIRPEFNSLDGRRRDRS
jgi:glycosyltransferase involved in cell wall biosynthesis